ncbi:uncharacterized protein LOC111949264 [Oryzias latipes]|uniref:uncharacterized protein LOC111949264 n=1 Tax=Oryzias latipes TaxID=8090 RepID=UPI000CE1B921|nr:uncharacterized protein LOC111949264 [Oryzias latipes]
MQNRLYQTQICGQTPPPQVLLTCCLLLLAAGLPHFYSRGGLCTHSLSACLCTYVHAHTCTAPPSEQTSSDFVPDRKLLSGRVTTAEEEPHTSMSSSPVTPEFNPQPPSSSSPAPPLRSLRSPELQAEFLKERQNKFQFHDDISSSTVPPSPSSSCSSSPRSSSTSPDGRRARLSLSSPELLTELKESRTRPLRHVPPHGGMTVVFSGRGRGAPQVSGSAPAAKPTNPRTSH